jgi:hypothetical protein
MKPLLFASSTWIKGYQPSDIAKKQLQDLLKDQLMVVKWTHYCVNCQSYSTPSKTHVELTQVLDL